MDRVERPYGMCRRERLGGGQDVGSDFDECPA